MSTTNFSGFGGGVSAISTGPLIVSMTVPQPITTSFNPVIWNNINNTSRFMDYNTSTGVFTCLYSGFYMFQLFYSFSNVVSLGAPTYSYHIYNGTALCTDNLWTNAMCSPLNNQIIFQSCDTYWMAVGDTFLIQVNCGTTNIIDGDPTVSRAHAILLTGGTL